MGDGLNADGLGFRESVFGDVGSPDNQPSVFPDRLGGQARKTVYTTSQLDSAFTNLSQGDTIAISQPDTPYRPSQWLDIDVSDVTILCESAFARNGEHLVKVADNADVGGIRVGSTSAVTNVEIAGYGHDGNKNNQDQSVLRLHGIIVEDATEVEVHHCHITQPSPYQNDPAGSAHDTGGSGLTVRSPAEEVDVHHNVVDDTGDRGIQVAGENIRVHHNTCKNGFDRGIATIVKEPDENFYYARRVEIDHNIVYENIEGSLIGTGAQAFATQRTDRGEYNIHHNILFGSSREGIKVAGDVRSVTVNNNIHWKTASNADAVGQSVVVLGGDNVTDEHYVVSNNISIESDDNGFKTGTDVTNYLLSNNTAIDPAAAGIVAEGQEGVLDGNDVSGAGTVGILASTAKITINGGRIERCQEQGILANKTTNETTIRNVTLHLNDRGGNTVPELDMQDDDALIMGNRVEQRGGNVSFADGSNSQNVAWIGNFGDLGVPSSGNWDLSNPATTVGNSPEPVLDSEPTQKFIGSQVLASSTWDPDGDGNGERVEWDGASWNEVVDMPNL